MILLLALLQISNLKTSLQFLNSHHPNETETSAPATINFMNRTFLHSSIDNFKFGLVFFPKIDIKSQRKHTPQRAA